MKSALAAGLCAFLLLEPAQADMSPVPSWTMESNQSNAYLGGHLQTAGDVNGDGYSDVIVAATAYDNGQTDEGRVFLYLGSASGLTSASWSAEGDQAGAAFGTAVAAAGDVNGDGYDDVLVGASSRDNGQTDEGQVFLYLGSPSGLATMPAWSVECTRGIAPSPKRPNSGCAPSSKPPSSARASASP